MGNNTIIVFAKTPEPGKVKTRIAAQLGDEIALQIYNQLLQFTFSLIGDLAYRKIVYYAGEGSQDYWKGLETRKQASGDLGNRMAIAFEEVLSEGEIPAIIIGTDCASLTKEIIESAFTSLATNDLVIGPATDGGYYLLGIKKNYPLLFEHIDWSTEKVFEQTIQHAKNLSLSYHILPVLTDIDEAHQVPEGWY
ncbi:MAG: TIGR04282 family arsenosugar biosynthesis glycosyltransferase [Chitinophagaceae bacterium]|jgi:rSAM/selenodomain-associated transferase 1|nr:TIGR04282 family arsenosugar biosynthesis glycosyltransferase [Chitinophagaceae bacterium]